MLQTTVAARMEMHLVLLQPSAPGNGTGTAETGARTYHCARADHGALRAIERSEAMTKKGPGSAAAFAKLWGGFRASRVVLTANNLRLFEHVGTGTSASVLAAALRTDPRATEILLDALAALGLLGKRKATYKLTPLSKQYLLPESPVYQGDMLRHADSLWKSWSGLDEVVRTGQPNRTGERHHEVFIRAMHNNALPRARKVVSALDLRGVKRALDLGGGPGTYSIALARKGIEVTLFDLPNTLYIARGIAQAAGVKKISFLGGDFHFDDIGGPYDLVLLRSEERRVGKEC